MRNLAITTLLLLLCSCGQSHRLAETAPTPGFPGTHAFPAPSSLSHTVSGPPADFDRYANGFSPYGSGWPQQRIDTFGNELTMSPSWDPSAPDMADLSYACYYIGNMAGYDGKKRIKLIWNDPAPSSQDIYVGLANEAHDRWDWFRVNANQEAYFTAPYAEYIDVMENMYLIVLSAGNQDEYLNRIVVGDSFLGSVDIGTDLNQNPTQNIAPLTVNFDGSATPYGSFITRYDWDWDSDGVYDVLNEQHPSHTFDPGTWTVTLRVTDAEGASATGTETFVAINPANQAPSAFFNCLGPQSGVAPLQCDFTAASSSDPDGSIIKYEWDFNGDQTVDYTSTSPTASFVFAQKGTVQVGLSVTDNDLAVASYSLPINVNQGWTSTAIDSGIQLGDWFGPAVGFDVGSFGSVSQRVGVVYHDETSDTLRFARSTSDTGNAWYAPTNPVSGTGIGYSPQLKPLLSGVPIVAYGERSGQVYVQHVVTATSDSGASWNAPQTVAAGMHMGDDTSLAVINTLPALAGVTDSNDAGTNNVAYVLATNSQGTNWAAPAHAYYPAGYLNLPQLSVAGSGLFKHPAVLFTVAYSQGANLRFGQSSDVDGTTWPSFAVLYDCYYPSLNNIDGRPAYVRGVHSATNSELGLQYSRAEDADGVAWQHETKIGSGGNGQLLVWNGKPAVVFVDDPTPSVQLVVAKDPDGTAWDAPYNIQTAPGITAVRGTVVNGNLVVAYYNDLDKDLRCAFYN